MSETTQQEQMDFRNYDVIRWPMQVDFEKDLLWHQGKWPSDSWFAVGNLKSNGHSIGYQAHFLWKVISEDKTMISVNISVVDQTTGTYYCHDYLLQPDEVEIATDVFDVKSDHFRFAGNTDALEIYAKIPNAVIDVKLARTEPILPLNGSGAVPFIGVEQYDYAFPGMSTSGTITMKDEVFDVTGPTWIDRQYGNVPDFFKDPAAITSMKWLWMNVQLENGIRISLGETIRMNCKELMIMCTVMYPDGSIGLAKMRPIETYDYWTSPETGRSYPTRFRVEIPSLDSRLEIVVIRKNSEIVSQWKANIKYEGASKVTGTFNGKEVSGECFSEVFGYWG